jgi:hypothetical protein
MKTYYTTYQEKPEQEPKGTKLYGLEILYNVVDIRI